MIDTGNEKTVGIKRCEACGGGLLQSDRFCRWCSVRQIDSASTLFATERLETQMPPADVENEQPSTLYRPVSGPLVKVMAKSVSTGALAQPRSPITQTLLAAVLSFPVWLMIVFLSPFDAYFAARTMARRS